MTHSKSVLVVGCGSVGKRHARNLATLGCKIYCMDPRKDRREEIASELQSPGAFATIEEALHQSFDGVVVASPPHVHAAQTMTCLEIGLPVLLEKPVAPSLMEAERVLAALETSTASVLLGYTWRWWPALRSMNERLQAGAIGQLLHVRYVMSAHLADWHPWERYQDFFMSNKDQGGGALLDESHWIDQMIWWFGMPNWCQADIGKLSNLEIDVDDNVDALFGFRSGLRVSVHLDIYGRPHEKSISAVGDKGTLRWRDQPNEISYGTEGADNWTVEPFKNERNDMFVSVASEFMSVVDGAKPSCTLQEGVDVLRVIEGMRESAARGTRIAF